MRSLMAFFKKEWQESLANYRLIIILAVFFLFGLLNVFTAKYTPQLISSLVSEEFAQAIPTPTLIDVWLQFFKNIGQMGIIIVVILFSSTLTGEYTKGTLTLLITKGLPRWQIITAKLLTQMSLFSIAYWLSAGVSALYGMYYFDALVIPDLVFSLIILWVFGLFLLTLIMFASVLFSSGYLVLLFVGGINVVLMLLNMIPNIKTYNPINLFTSSSAMIQQGIEASSLNEATLVTVLTMLVLYGISLVLFNRKSL